MSLAHDTPSAGLGSNFCSIGFLQVYDSPPQTYVKAGTGLGPGVYTSSVARGFGMGGALVHHHYRLRVCEMVQGIGTPTSGHCSVSRSLTANEY